MICGRGSAVCRSSGCANSLTSWRCSAPKASNCSWTLAEMTASPLAAKYCMRVIRSLLRAFSSRARSPVRLPSSIRVPRLCQAVADRIRVNSRTRPKLRPSFRLTLRLANQLFIYVSSPVIKKGTAGCCSYESRGVWVREAAARLRLQSRRQLIEFGGQLVQRRTGLGGMVDVLLVGRGNLGDLGDIARDVLRYAGLLLGRGSNLAVHVADGLYRQRDLLQAVARQGHLLHAGVTAVLAAFDRPGGLLG